MNVYKYISEVNPAQANVVCMSYGYPYANSCQEIEYYLVEIVTKNGENGLKKIMEIHPDKDILTELFQSNNLKQFANQKEHKFGSPDYDKSGTQTFGVPIKIVKKNATGSTANKTNTLILVSALIVSLAIILK